MSTGMRRRKRRTRRRRSKRGVSDIEKKMARKEWDGPIAKMLHNDPPP